MEFSTRWQVVGDEGSLLNWASLWDDFVMWKKNARGMGTLPNILVHVHVSVGLSETSFAKEQAYDRYQLILHTKRLPPMWGEKHQTLGRHQITMYIEAETTTTLSVKWTGDLSAFAGLFVV